MTNDEYRKKTETAIGHSKQAFRFFPLFFGFSRFFTQPPPWGVWGRGNDALPGCVGFLARKAGPRRFCRFFWGVFEHPSPATLHREVGETAREDARPIGPPFYPGTIVFGQFTAENLFLGFLDLGQPMSYLPRQNQRMNEIKTVCGSARKQRLAYAACSVPVLPNRRRQFECAINALPNKVLRALLAFAKENRNGQLTNHDALLIME
jgi:hypothetical protein